MDNPAISLILIALTALSIAAAAVAVRRLVTPQAHKTTPMIQHGLLAVIAAVCGGIFVYRWIFIQGHWQPLAAHLDGLLLIAALLAVTILFIQSRPRLFGLSAFAIPLLAFILAWAVCAAAWTYHPFHIDRLDRVWDLLHLAGVYLGTLCAAVAAMAGGMYLYVQHRLRRKQDLRGLGKLASLEALESLIIAAATLGFALLTLGLAAGVVIFSQTPANVHPGWWYSPQIVLGVIVWVLYALLMNVRYASRFRGARAAWLSIVGLVLLIATYGAVTAWPPRVGDHGGGAKVRTVSRSVPVWVPLVGASQTSAGGAGGDGGPGGTGGAAGTRYVHTARPPVDVQRMRNREHAAATYQWRRSHWSAKRRPVAPTAPTPLVPRSLDPSVPSNHREVC